MKAKIGEIKKTKSGKIKTTKNRGTNQNLTPNKLLTRFTVILAQIKAKSNSYKLENGIRQIVYILCQQNKITKTFTTI